MPREAARKRCLQSPVIRQISPDSHVFPHLGHPVGCSTIVDCGGLIRSSRLRRVFLGMERHLLFTCPDECGNKPDAATRTSTRRVRQI